MKGGFLLAGLGVLALLGGCAGRPGAALPVTEAPRRQERAENYRIGAYPGREEGEGIPPWAEAYLEGTLGELPGYEGKYLFAAENSGPSDRLLRQWAEHFSVAQDFPRLAAARIEGRYTRAALKYPDDEYGSFFPMMIRAVSDGFYGGAVREADFWFRRQLPEEEGSPREEYCFLILVSVDKFLFERRVHDILNRIVPDPPLSREQASAVRRATDSLFDGF
jgi:hypothetical protein